MEVVAYHMYHLKNRTEVIPWREETPEILTKHKLFSKRCMENYLNKMNKSDKVFVEQKK